MVRASFVQNSACPLNRPIRLALRAIVSLLFNQIAVRNVITQFV